LGRDLVTDPLAEVSFYASNRDDALASVAPARHFPVHESNNGSGAYSATWLERQPYLPCGTPLLSSSAGCRDCSNKEQRTLCNGGTCMTKANSWRGHNTSLPPSPSQALASSLSRTKTKAEEEFFVLKLRGRKCRILKKIPPPIGPKVRVQTGRFRPISDRYLQ
jgi:hypothetical protein